jgi:hypothetical protein
MQSRVDRRLRDHEEKLAEFRKEVTQQFESNKQAKVVRKVT